MPDDHDTAADLRAIADLRERARRARYVAHQISDAESARGLLAHAEQLECRADALSTRYTMPAAATVASGEPSLAQAGAALKTDTPPEPEPKTPAETEPKPTPPASADKSEPEPA